MSLTSAFTAPCEGNTGGTVNLWLANKSDITSFTESGGEFTAVTMVATKVMYNYSFEQDTCEYKASTARTNYSSVITHSIEFYLNKMTTTQRNAVQALIDSSICGIVAIVEDANNNKWVIGYSANFGTARSMRVQTTEGGTGKAFSDMNGTTVTLQSSDNEMPKVFTGTVPV